MEVNKGILEKTECDIIYDYAFEIEISTITVQYLTICSQEKCSMVMIKKKQGWSTFPHSLLHLI